MYYYDDVWNGSKYACTLQCKNKLTMITMCHMRVSLYFSKYIDCYITKIINILSANSVSYQLLLLTY